MTDLKHDYSTTFICQVDKLDLKEVATAFSNMEQQGRAILEEEGVQDKDRDFLRQVDMRYVGQSYELTVPLSGTEFTPAEIEALLIYFHREHDRAYGYSAPEEPAEFVNLRLSAIGRIAKPRLRSLDSNLDAPALKTSRPVYFSEHNGFVDCPIYDRYTLAAGNIVNGPAIVEEIDSTTVIYPGYRGTVDTYGDLTLTGE